MFYRFLPYELLSNDEIHVTDNDQILSFMNQQTSKQERNCLCHILPPWKKIHLSIPQIARSFTWIRMSIHTINQAHEIYAQQLMIIKILTIINEIFTELKCSSKL